MYVAAQDIPLGTPGSDVAHRNMLRVEHVTTPKRRPGRDLTAGQIDKLVAVEPIYAGEQISTRRFRTAEEQGIRAQLKGNLRALAGSRQQSQLLGGVAEGRRPSRRRRHVDACRKACQNHISRVVLRNLLVLQAPGRGQHPGQDRGQSE